VVTIGNRSTAVSLATFHYGKLYAEIDGQPYIARSDWKPGDPVIRLRESESEYIFQLTRLVGGYRFTHGGVRVIVSVRRPDAAAFAELMQHKAVKDTLNALRCPMPGLNVSVNVTEGQEVKVGDPLAVVEAMKMENVLTAERDATVNKISAKKGDSVALDDVIMEFA
jgi:propionyl-CoA carboxylase alpha chain